jgi:hypothetical protein
MLQIIDALKTAVRLVMPLVDVIHNGKTDDEKKAEVVSLLKPEVDVVLDLVPWGDFAAYKPFVKSFAESDAVLGYAVTEAWKLGALAVEKVEAVAA